MKTISSIFGMPKYSGPLMGLEVEVEAQNALPNYVKKFLHYTSDSVPVYSEAADLPINWKAVDDGSLRGYSKEYVSEKPKTHKDLRLSYLPNLLIHLKDNTINHNSPRVSTHVHVNVTDRTYQEVLNACVLWWSLENCLIEWCGKTRVGNNFCLGINDATRQVLNVIKDVKSFHSGQGCFRYFNPEDSKYYALNLCRVQDLGTLEFRSFPGLNFNDPSRLYTWLEQIEFIMNASRWYADPREIWSCLDKDGADAFAKKHLLPSIYNESSAAKVEKNELYITQLAWCVSNWKEKKEVEKKRKSNTLTGNHAAFYTATLLEEF